MLNGAIFFTTKIFWAKINTFLCGCNSVAEYLLPKQRVASSNLVTRSRIEKRGTFYSAPLVVIT